MSLPFVVVPSGNNNTRGYVSQEAFLCIQILESTFLYQIANKLIQLNYLILFQMLNKETPIKIARGFGYFGELNFIITSD